VFDEMKMRNIPIPPPPDPEVTPSSIHGNFPGMGEVAVHLVLILTFLAAIIWVIIGLGPCYVHECPRTQPRVIYVIVITPTPGPTQDGR
jgi:hypothetical protein